MPTQICSNVPPGMVFIAKYREFRPIDRIDIDFSNLFNPIIAPMGIDIQILQRPAAQPCSWCGCRTTRENLRGGIECSGCAHPLEAA